jgi:hypothetical protein
MDPTEEIERLKSQHPIAFGSAKGRSQSSATCFWISK